PGVNRRRSGSSKMRQRSRRYRQYYLPCRSAPVTRRRISFLTTFGTSSNRWPGNSGSQSDRLGIFEIGIYGSNHDASLDRYQIYADQRYSYPRIDYNALVQDSIKHINETCATGCSLNRHANYPFPTRESATLSPGRICS